MKFVLAFYGTRGDVEPGVAIGRELLQRGHEVVMAVPPDYLGLSERAGLRTVPYGLDTCVQADGHRDFWTNLFRNFWRIRELQKLWSEVWAPIVRCWAQMSTTLKPLAADADVLFSGIGYEQVAANVAEYYDIPSATLHWLPITRVNGQLMPSLPSWFVRSVMRTIEWINWLGSMSVENSQRRELGLARATRPSPFRAAARRSLEIQAYDRTYFPGLSAEWSRWKGLRPFVGALTMEYVGDSDDEVASWIAAGTEPIYFGFGSIPLGSPADTVAMIAAASSRLGERALICSNGSDFDGIEHYDHVKVVDSVNYAAILPSCRAVVHHGGAGTTAAGLRAGVPTLVLWMGPEQLVMGAQIKELKVGTARRLSATNCDSLVADLTQILAPEYADRARDFASRMTKPDEGVVNAADLLESFARSRSAGQVEEPSARADRCWVRRMRTAAG